MEHEAIERTQATDRYLLGELSAAEREDFEEHMFSCPACAEDVRAGMLFRANAKAVFRDEAERKVGERESARWSWLSWLSAKPAMAASWAALCAVLAFTGYQNLLVMPELQSQLAEATGPQSYRSFALRSVSRGDDLAVELSTTERFIGLSVVLDPEQRHGAYRAEFADGAGTVRFTVTRPARSEPGLKLEFLVPASSLSTGPSTMNLYGLEGMEDAGPGTKVGNYSFIVKRTQGG